MKQTIACLTAFTSLACSGLRPFPSPSACPKDGNNLAGLWQCMESPGSAPKEGGLASTLRIANGDLTRRVILNQTPSLACNTKPWSGFEHVSVAVTSADRMEAFVHAGDAAKPVVFVIHGLYDSNSNRYVRYTASALADHGFGVVVPDMRWHGCLNGLTNTLGVLESADLMAWAKAIRDGQIAMSNRPIGMIGFSLGALDVIDTASLPEAVSRFDAGAIAVSPPAAVDNVRERLDGLRTLTGLYFRLTLRMRNRRLGIPFWSREPFRSYLELVAASDVTPFHTMDALIAAAEPTRRLANIRRPLLILAAKNDPVLGQGAADAIANAADESLTYVHVIETDEGGHIGIIGRDPQWFVNAMTRFFDLAQHVPPRP